MSVHDGGLMLAEKGDLACEALVENAPQRVHIRLRGQGLALELLGRGELD